MFQKLLDGFEAVNPIAIPKIEFAMVRCSCCNKKVPGRIIHWVGMDHEEEPLWMPCKVCGKFLSHTELGEEGISKVCNECAEEEKA